jgi:hypothetical protein
MLPETIARLEAEIAAAGLTPEKRAEIQRSLTALRDEISRSGPRGEQLELSLAGLRRSVLEFERSHPRLVDAVASLASSLSGMGL